MLAGARQGPYKGLMCFADKRISGRCARLTSERAAGEGTPAVEGCP